MSLVNEIQVILDDLKAQNILILNVGQMTSVTDYLVICSGTSSRHVAALADKLVMTLKEKEIKPLHVDGLTTAEWVLVDYVDVVVHIMRPETRLFYNLEGLWSQPLSTAQQG